MRFGGISLLLLSFGSLTYAKCNYDNIIVDNEIASIAKELNISKCQAGDIFDVIINSNSVFENAINFSVDNLYSVKQCQKVCETANSKVEQFLGNYKLPILELVGQTIDSNDLYERCLSDCELLPDILKHKVEIHPSELIAESNKQKRDLTCDPVSSSSISLVESNYQNNIPRYQQDAGSAPTALQEVNGCGPKLLDKFNVSEVFNGIFLPACNSHDVCYGCQKGKAHCDSLFLSNMQMLCNKKYSSNNLADIALRAECYGIASIFYKAVDLFGAVSYNLCPLVHNSSTNCAYCGNSIVRTVLVNSPYYIKN